MKRPIVRCYLSALTFAAGIAMLAYGDLWGLLVLALSAVWQFDRPLSTVYVPGVDRSPPGTLDDMPYPAVFRDWREADRRVATNIGLAGVIVEMWEATDLRRARLEVELTEEDGALLAVSLLRRVGYIKDAEGDDRFARLADETLARLGWLF